MSALEDDGTYGAAFLSPYWASVSYDYDRLVREYASFPGLSGSIGVTPEEGILLLLDNDKE